MQRNAEMEADRADEMRLHIQENEVIGMTTSLRPKSEDPHKTTGECSIGQEGSREAHPYCASNEAAPSCGYVRVRVSSK